MPGDSGESELRSRPGGRRGRRRGGCGSRHARGPPHREPVRSRTWGTCTRATGSGARVARTEHGQHGPAGEERRVALKPELPGRTVCGHQSPAARLARHPAFQRFLARSAVGNQLQKHGGEAPAHWAAERLLSRVGSAPAGCVAWAGSRGLSGPPSPAREGAETLPTGFAARSFLPYPKLDLRRNPRRKLPPVSSEGDDRDPTDRPGTPSGHLGGAGHSLPTASSSFPEIKARYLLGRPGRGRRRPRAGS